MRKLIKKQVTKFTLHLTCEICGREEDYLCGFDFESDHEAHRKVPSDDWNGWFIGLVDGRPREVCACCWGKACEEMREKGIELPKGFFTRPRAGAKHALKMQGDRKEE